jgi:hypothetical protein
MIFPELPRRQQYWQQQPADQVYHTANSVNSIKTPLRGVEHSVNSIKTPLRGVEQTATTGTVDVEQWFRDHGLAADPAAGMYTRSRNEPIDWLARDAWELYGLITVFAVWLTFWLGIHRGWW